MVGIIAFGGKVIAVIDLAEKFSFLTEKERINNM